MTLNLRFAQTIFTRRARHSLGAAALAVAAVVVPNATNSAETKETYEQVWQEATADSACNIIDEPNVKRVECRAQRVTYYFTKPGHRAHQGVAKRSLVKQADGYHIDTKGFCFDVGTRANCQRWLEAFRSQDEATKKNLQGQ